MLRRLGLVALVLALGAAWWWQHTLPLAAIRVTGTVHADPASIARRTGARVDSAGHGDTVFSLVPALVAERVEGEPWVRAAHVRRLPTGTLHVRVDEREPVVLVLDGGRPSHFLDAAGVAFPLDAPSDSAAAAAGAVPYDVPLLSGAPPAPTYGQAVESPALRGLLAALAAADDATNALVAEIEWHGPRRTVLWTTAAGGHPSVPVRLGPSDPAGQLARLRAFWDQSVLPRPGHRFESVDLRFRGQVVTHEPRPVAPGEPAGRARTGPDSTLRAPVPLPAAG